MWAAASDLGSNDAYCEPHPAEVLMGCSTAKPSQSERECSTCLGRPVKSARMMSPALSHSKQVLSEICSSMSRGTSCSTGSTARFSLEAERIPIFYLPSNRRDRKLNGLVAFVLALTVKNACSPHCFLASRCWMDMALRIVSDIVPSRLLPEFARACPF